MKFNEIVQSNLIKSLIKQDIPEKVKFHCINEVCEVGAKDSNIGRCRAITSLKSESISNGLHWVSMPSGYDFWRKVAYGNVTVEDISKEPERIEWKTSSMDDFFVNSGMSFCGELLGEQPQPPSRSEVARQQLPETIRQREETAPLRDCQWWRE